MRAIPTSTAFDPDGDDLSFEASLDGVTMDRERRLDANTYSFEYTAPETLGEYTIHVTVEDGRGGSDSLDLPVRVIALPETTLNVVWDETGLICQGGAVSNRVFAGDSAINESCSGYISFDITALSGKTVRSIRFAMSSVTEYGDRSSFGNLWIGTLDYGTGPLQASDRNIPAQHLATFPNSVTAISYDGEDIGFSGQSMKTALQSRIDAGNPRFQLAVYWSNPGSNGNGALDGLGYPSGSISLRVRYTD